MLRGQRVNVPEVRKYRIGRILLFSSNLIANSALENCRKSVPPRPISHKSNSINELNRLSLLVSLFFVYSFQFRFLLNRNRLKIEAPRNE